MAKSKVTSILFNREWRRPEGGSVFYFDIKFEDGLEGQFSTNKKEQTKFTLHEEAEYEQKGTNKVGTKMIDTIRDKPQFKSTYNDPLVNVRIAMSVSLGAAIKTAINLGMKDITEDDVFAIANYYFKWITEGENSRDIYSLKWNSILNAADYMAMNEIQNSKGVLESAKEFYRIIENVQLP
jgi:hypothetical protein